MEAFVKGNGFVPADGDVYEVAYDCDGSELVVTIDYKNGADQLPIDTRTGKELSDDLVWAEVKAWRKLN